MTQEIIVYILIALAVTNSLYHFFIILTNKKQSTCSGCPDCELKQEIIKKYK
jgi:hypothetical protein